MSLSSTSGPSAEQHQSVLASFRDHIKSGVTHAMDASTIMSVLDALKNTNAIDDRKMLLEHLLTMMAHHPDGAISQKLQTATVQLLYNDLPHPPATYIGNQYAWRTADGSYNNVVDPEMGKAGTPYARSVQQTHPIPKDSLPDPGLVFDTLLKREGFVRHPAGLSSMFFSFAALVIHSVFRTSHTDVNINETSSYVDLSPLYGHNQEAQDRVRVRDGRGVIYPDVFAEDRLLLLPPAVCVILVLFSRNHNYIAKRLLEINERGTWVDPSTLSSDDPKKSAQLLKQEEEIFQIARLINSTWFAMVVFSDYFSCILGLIRDGSSWSLNPFGEIRNADHTLFARGEGNVCSVEFNCLYRWHATTSAEDEKWVQTVFEQIFDGKAPEDVTPQDFGMAARKIQAMEPDIQHWTFSQLERQENGSFKDSDLANILMNSTDHHAAAFRARGTPATMRLHEIMGIEQNRKWGVCSLNDFRRFLGLKPYASFKEWNPNPEIYDAAEKLYGDIERLELYVGLQAEEAKPVMEGAGLCPGYTISRAILSDAIALTRGDRFFTSDFTPFNMTAWGFADAQRDPSGAGFGSTLGRLILRNLPNDFTSNSHYTWFPLMTPDAMKPHLSKMHLTNTYDSTRPSAKSPDLVVTDYTQVAEILKNPTTFPPLYSKMANKVIKGTGFFLASPDAAVGQREQREIFKALVNSPVAMDKIGQFFYQKTRELINVRSYTLVGGKVSAVDIVRDVYRYAPLHWSAGELAGIRIKTKSNPLGDYTEEQLFLMLADIYSFVFLDVEAAKLLVLEEKVSGYVEELLDHIKNTLYAAGGSRISYIFESIGQIFGGPKNAERQEFITRLYALGHSTDHLANSILAIMVGCSVEMSLSLTNAINLFLEKGQSAELRTLSAVPGPEFDTKVIDALRADPPFRGVYRIARMDQSVGTLSVQKDQKVFVDVAGANADNLAKGEINADVTVRCLGKELSSTILGSVLRATFGYANLRRGPGQSGTLTRFKTAAHPYISNAYLDPHHYISPWPTSMVVQYDGKPGAKI